MKTILNCLALIAMLFSATSFASCEKTLPMGPMDITSIKSVGDGLHCIINNTYIVDLDRDLNMQVDGYPGDAVTSVPLLVTINNILFSTTGVANITPTDAGNVKQSTAMGKGTRVKARFHEEIDGRIIVQITAVVL